MSSPRSPGKQRRNRRAAEQKKSSLVFGLIVAGTALAIVAAIVVMKPTKEPSEKSPGSRTESTSSGSAEVLGVESDSVLVELGLVPLDQTVEPAWTLTNTSESVVHFGKAHAEAIEGCCPGPLEFGQASLAPGEETQLVFPLQMHAGMDGPHEFDVHVPVERGGRQEILTLSVTGDFRG